MENLKLNISGMSCGHCVGRVTKALSGVPGVEVKDVKIGGATVAYDPAATTPDTIAGVVTDAGYDAEPVVAS